MIQDAYNPATGHSYALLSDASWTVAEARAVEMGGHLVTVNDSAENTWIWNTFQYESFGNIWIGLNDINQEGTFEWVSGEPFLFQWWWWSEPNDLNGTEDYGCIWGWYGGAWNDFNDYPNGWGTWHGLVELDGMYAHLPTPAVAGVDNNFQVSGGTPGGNVYYIASGNYNAGGSPVPGCPSLTTNLGAPIQVLGLFSLDLTGAGSIDVAVPAGLSGFTGYLQAVDLGNCMISNTQTVTFS